jgi:hypothetical protein
MKEFDLYERALCKWGEAAQVQMMIEEMAELTKALCKRTRKVNGCSINDVINEIVDVEIMLGQMKVVFLNPTLKGRDFEEIKLDKLIKLKQLVEG